MYRWKLVMFAAIFFGMLGWYGGMAGVNVISGGGVNETATAPQEFESCQNNKTLRCSFDMTSNYMAFLSVDSPYTLIMIIFIIPLGLGIVYILAMIAKDMIPFT